AYVQQLESSRLKLIQLEKELEQAREQGLYIGGGLEAGHLGFSRAVNPGPFVNGSSGSGLVSMLSGDSSHNILSSASMSSRKIL
ncbi:hypothetical protein Godav_006178, partial [Gossypium davidsonii]|nr:hypothetical protein [Gossypium davidsonii]